MLLAQYLIIACGLLALFYGLVTSKQVLAADAGTTRMQEISAAVQEGARAYLNRQYTTIGIVGVVILIILGLTLGLHVAIGFIIGAVLSAAAGYIGMNVSVRANVRTAQAAKRGLSRRPGSRIQGRRGYRTAGGRSRPARRRRLLLRAAQRHDQRQRRRVATRAGGDGGAGLRRVADLHLRPPRRRNLHQGRRCRRRPGRQGRGRHPRGRSPQPRRHRRQRGRQRRRLRRHGRRPVRDLCGDHRRHHAPGRDLLHRCRAGRRADAAPGHRRHLHPDIDSWDLLRQTRPRQRHHEGAVQGACW